MPRKNPSSSLQAANNSSFIYHKLWQPKLFLKKNEDLCATALSRDPQTRSGLDFGTQETTSKQLLTTFIQLTDRPTGTCNGVTWFLKHIMMIQSSGGNINVARPSTYLESRSWRGHDCRKQTKKPKPSLKIGTANAICYNSLGLFRDYGQNHIFVKPHKILTHSRPFLFPYFVSVI